MPRKKVQSPTYTANEAPVVPHKTPILPEEPAPAKRHILLPIVVALVAIAVIWIGIAALQAHGNESPTGFSAVYLASGEVLVGKLSLFGAPVLTDTWIVEYGSSTGGGQGAINLVPFQNTSVSPENVVHLSPPQMLYWANLNPESTLVKELEAKAP
jgi:hypothetical protein